MSPVMSHRFPPLAPPLAAPRRPPSLPWGEIALGAVLLMLLTL